MTYIDERIADCAKRLEVVNAQIDDLKRQAAVIEGQLRAYRDVKDSVRSWASEAREPKVSNKPKPKDVTSGPEKVSLSRLSPVWQHIFAVMVSAYPKQFTDGEIRDLARKYGQDPKDSFRTSLWHHHTRGSLDRSPQDGSYIANELTAKKAGVPWGGEGGKVWPEP